MAALTVGLMVFLTHTVKQITDGNRVIARNFYGVLRVVDPDDPAALGATRSLANGMINHGEQFLDPKRAMTPTTYYGPHSGIGLAIKEAQEHGPVSRRRDRPGNGDDCGLWPGVGDAYEFYDINPLVIRAGADAVHVSLRLQSRRLGGRGRRAAFAGAAAAAGVRRAGRGCFFRETPSPFTY